MPVRVSAAAARRMALAAQGFRDPAPAGAVDRRHYRRVLGRLGLLQLDSVQAVCRSHYLPLFSRIGPYDRERLDDWLWQSGELFEAWAHEASIVTVDLEPALRHRKEAAAKGETWAGLARLAAEQSEYVEDVYREIAERGPLTARQLSEPRRRSGAWWDGRSDGKRALDWLFRIGRVGSRRTGNFERVYDLFERVVAEPVRARPTPDREEAVKWLLVEAAACHGIGTASDLADYHRSHGPTCRGSLRELVEDGRLLEAEVEGWAEPAYVHPDTTRVRGMDARALLSPFDPVVWRRERAERLFDFRYRIEIYVPEREREYGYYVLPFLLGDRLVGRVDVRADRGSGVLRVLGCWHEDGVDVGDTGEHLAAELRRLATFLGLDDLQLADRGSLAAAVRPALLRNS